MKSIEDRSLDLRSAFVSYETKTGFQNINDPISDRLSRFEEWLKKSIKDGSFNLNSVLAAYDSIMSSHRHSRRSDNDLMADRMVNVQKWITRSQNLTTMVDAFGPTVVNFTTITHAIDFAGNFGPGIIALEYDMLVVGSILFIGFNPVVFTQNDYNPSRTRWITDDILEVEYTQDVTNGYNTSTGQYKFTDEQFIFYEYLVFDPNSSLINLGFSKIDPGLKELYILTTSEIPIAAVCAGFIFPACNVTNASGYNYLLDTGFSSVLDCITFMSSLPPQPCPFEYRSNTTTCRTLHGLSAFFLPSVHCAHVRPDSAVCTSACLPACSNCDANAKCVATYPNFPNTLASFNPVYKCQCNNGYVGNGTSCTTKQCSYGNCPAPFGSYNCSSGLCMCTNTYTAQPELLGAGNTLCSCPAPSIERWYSGAPYCVPAGRCINDQNRYMCNLQQYTRVKCLALDNSFNFFGGCFCNYGFSGGLTHSCSCDSPKRVEWSNVVSGEVCLSSTECTATWQCSGSQTCTIPSGQAIGACA